MGDCSTGSLRKFSLLPFAQGSRKQYHQLRERTEGRSVKQQEGGEGTDSGPMVGLLDSTKDTPEVQSFELKVRPVGVVVFLSPVQLPRCRCGACRVLGFHQSWGFAKQA